MKFFRKAIFTACMLGTVTGAPHLATSAHAQPADAIFSSPGFLEIVSGGEVVANGTDAVTLHIIAMNPDGTPMTGLKLRVNASGGSVSPLTEVGGGLYAFDYLPGIVTTPTTAQISVKGKTADRANLEATYNLPVRPPLSTGLNVVSNPGQIVLGQDKDATLSFTLEGAVGTLSARDLQVNLSSGEVTNLTHLGKGRFTARFVAPKVNYPQLSILTVADRRNPSAVYGQLTVPLVGKTDYPVRAAPGATIILRIAGQEYGPVQADETGRAKVPVMVPPGVKYATKIQVHNGVSTEDKIDLRVPETKRVQLYPMQKGLPADGSTKVPVRVLVLDREGNADVKAGVNFTATGGTISQATHEGNGIYVAEFTPKFSNEQMPGAIRVGLRGSSIQGDELKFTLVPARPESIRLKPEPSRLSKDAMSVRIFAKVLGPNGMGMPQRNIAFNLRGANARGSVQDLRNGDYRADFTTVGKSHVDVIALVSSKPTGNPVRNVFMFPTREVIPNDGLSNTPIVIVTTDEFGAPVPNVEVKLQLESGDGSIPNSITTSSNGVGTAMYASGRRPSLIRLRASAKNQTGAASFIQAPEGTTSPDLAVAGSKQHTALLQSWKRSVSTLRIEREGASEVDAGTVDIGTGQAGKIASIEATAQPATVAAGGTVKLVITAVDGQGRGVGGQSFDLMCSAGMFGGVNEMGGGKYETTLSVPPGASGDIKVSISSSNGGMSTFLKIPVSGKAVADAGTVGWGDAGKDAQSNFDGSQYEGPAEEKEAKKSADSNDGTWLRMGVGFVSSSYQYTQRSLQKDGPLIPLTLNVGGEDGGKNATPIGADVDVKGWLSNVGLKYVGFNAGFRAAAWSLTAPEFNGQVAPDTLLTFHVDASGRYPLEVGNSELYLAGHVGFMMNDFVYFTGSFDEGQVRYETLMVPSLRTGLELGFEVDGLFTSVAMTRSWAYLQTPYQLEIDGQVGYQLTDRVFADVSVEWYQRSLVLQGKTSGRDVGELSDQQLTVSVGAGLSF